MRVLLVHERFHPDNAGGGEYIALERAKGLMAAGHEVRVICAGDPAITEVEGVPTERLRLPRPALGLALPRLMRAARRADIVHAFNYYAAAPALAAARMVGRPAVCEQLGLFGHAWRRMRPGATGRAFEWLERRLLHLPYDRYLFLSPFSRDLALTLNPRLGPSEIVRPGLPPATEGGVAPAPAEGRAPGVLFAGKLDDRKGFDRFLRLAQARPDWCFEVFGWCAEGTGPPGMPANVALTLSRDRGGYRAALARASVLFMPSRAETFGLVIYEAMQSGLAVVSTVPGEYAGAWLETYSHEAAETALAARLDDPARAAAEGRANQETAAAYTWARSIEEVVAVYRAVLAGRGLSAG